MNRVIYLASRSPRRLALLGQLGLQCRVVPADIDETPQPGHDGREHALAMARAKARVVAVRCVDAPVLGADTDVVLDGRILGKPRDARDAERMLGLLSGRVHEVCSAVTVIHGQREASAVSVTRVQFAPLDAERIRRYVATGEPMDKAGAYALQGIAGAFVQRIEGSASGVIGLPLHETAELLRQFGVDLP